MDIIAASCELDHLPKLVGQIEVVIFSEIDQIGAILPEENLDLFHEGCWVADAVKSYKLQTVIIKMPREKMLVLLRTVVQKRIEFYL